MTDRPAAARPPQLGLVALFAKFLRFGLFAFGGPVAQIAMVRQALVDEERWIEPARFNRLLAILQILPGPEAHELCVHLGMVARGRIGGLLAGLGFMLPGLVLMLAAGWAYTSWVAGNAALTRILLAVQVAVLAIILRAVVRIGQHVVEDRLLAAVAAGAFAITLAEAPFWAVLIAAGAIYALASRPVAAALIAVAALALGVVIGLRGGLSPVGATAITTGSVTWLALFIAGLKGGLLTFGGAYTAIPYVRADTVGRGWLSDGTFLDGIALAGVLPAPLVIFATFTGYVVGGLEGALAITAGMFLPAFAFSLILFERMEAIVGNPALHRVLAGVAAAVVGIIAATFIQFAMATGVRVSHPLIAMGIFAVALVVAWRIKGAWVTPAILAGAALLGWTVNP